MMSNMKSATVRELQHHLSALLERVGRGEEITITKRGKTVARLVPAAPRRARVQWPDSAARMKRLFPAGPPPGQPPSEIVSEMRGDRR